MESGRSRSVPPGAGVLAGHREGRCLVRADWEHCCAAGRRMRGHGQDRFADVRVGVVVAAADDVGAASWKRC